jgi:pyridoxal phosphate enzyme (YggS family)
VQELVEKSNALKEVCLGIRWHFIGSLQSNKIPILLAKVPNLAAIHSVDSLKKLQTLVKEAGNTLADMDIYLQVNVSNEASKHGFTDPQELKEALALARPSRFRVAGLMAIGEPGQSERDFASLRSVRNLLLSELNVPVPDLALNMGMSDDYEVAIAQGSNVIRIGSAIFGARLAR